MRQLSVRNLPDVHEDPGSERPQSLKVNGGIEIHFLAGKVAVQKPQGLNKRSLRFHRPGELSPDPFPGIAFFWGDQIKAPQEPVPGDKNKVPVINFHYREIYYVHV